MAIKTADKIQSDRIRFWLRKKAKKAKKLFKKVLTSQCVYDIIVKRSAHGGIAQLARATGSYPVGHGFKSNSRYQNHPSEMPDDTRPVGQEVKTPPFHGSNMGSIPVRVTKRNKSELFRKSKLVRICFLL